MIGSGALTNSPHCEIANFLVNRYINVYNSGLILILILSSLIANSSSPATAQSRSGTGGIRASPPVESFWTSHCLKYSLLCQLTTLFWDPTAATQTLENSMRALPIQFFKFHSFVRVVQIQLMLASQRRGLLARYDETDNGSLFVRSLPPLWKLESKCSL